MEEKIIEIVEKASGQSVTKETNFKDDLGMDSLDVISVTMDVEEKYRILFDDETVAHFKTVNDLIVATKKLF